MSELKLPRLLAAAKEFNVGQDTLIDFLAKKGFNKEELKPAAKLTEPMYYALQGEFQNDKQAKNKADLVEIPKSQQNERRKRDEEDLSFRKDFKKPLFKEEPTKADNDVVVPSGKPVSEVENKVIPQATLPVVEKVAPGVIWDEINKVQETPKVVVDNWGSVVKIEAPELEGPKILSKIDLSAIDSSTRPRKASPRQEEEKVEAPKESVVSQPTTPVSVPSPPVQEVVAPIVTVEPVKEVVKETPPVVKEVVAEVLEQKAPAIEPIITSPKPTAEIPAVETPIIAAAQVHFEESISTISPVATEEAPLIENIQAEKLTGPKILGKIELPVDSDTRPKPSSAEDKKKRKRIPVDNRKVGGGHRPHHPSNQGFNQGQHPNHGQAIGQGHHPNQGFNPNQGQSTGQGHHPSQGFHPNQGQNQGHGHFQNRGPYQNNQGGFNRDRENRPVGSPNQHPNHPPQAPGTGTTRPIVPANNRGGGSGGGGFNRDNRGAGGGGYNRGAGGGRGGNRRDDKEIDAKEIQDKIKETQAKLAGGGGRGKSLKAKYRRAKREEAAEAMGDMEGEDNKLQVTEFVTVSELANLMDVSFADVIGKCMGLGIMVSINQRLDAEVIELVASEFDYEVEFLGVDDIEEMDEDEEEEEAAEAETRPPIVTIMGHVDHGKTSLLDHIRSANVVAGEAGGITQHIGAYEVTLPNGKAITFLDTPGHEAFTAMRARGAKVTDIAVIVVAADDAVMPQTKEAISHAQAAGVPMIFAVNKIDKDGANPQKIYEQLAGMNILVESWGGKYQSQELSAKKAINVDLLLEKILLEAELLDVKANPKKDATGSIIEASLDKGRGYVATILVQNGTLRQGDLLVSGQHYGRVKAMFNERNQRVNEAPPSTPVVILGLNGAPQAGEKFKVYQDEGEAKEVATKRAQISREQGLRARKHITLDEIGRRLALGNFKELNIIIKGDVDGSVEALSDSLQKLSNQEIAIRVVHKAVGQISESDILLAAASDAIIVGFNVRPSSQANKLAENEGVQVKMYSIIYTAIDEIRSAMEGMLEPKVEEKEVATVEVREVYKFDKATVAGCYVQEGKIKRDHKIRVFRDGILVYPRQEGGFAELGSLKRFKDDMKEVNNGYECGLTVKGFSDLNINDSIIAYEEEEVKRTL